MVSQNLENGSCELVTLFPWPPSGNLLSHASTCQSFLANLKNQALSIPEIVTVHRILRKVWFGLANGDCMQYH